MIKSFYRFEFKYLITSHVAGFIERELKHFGMKLDAPSVLLGDGYYVTSLYFDSYDFNDYQDKCGGFKERKKIRARIYEPFLDKSSSVLLELKKKTGEKVVKTQLKLNREEWEKFMDRGVSALVCFKRFGLENEAKNFHEAVRRGYLEQAGTKNNWVVIKGLGKIEDIAAPIRSAIEKLF